MALPAEASSSSSSLMSLTPESIRTFSPNKIFTEQIKPPNQFTSLDMDATGEYLITAGEDDGMNLYSCRKGTYTKTNWAKKYGCRLARFTHTRTSVLHTSHRIDYTIRYLDLQKSSYIRYFEGHTAPVTSVALAPQDDVFLSASDDYSVKLWDLRTRTQQGELKTPDTSRVTFDNTGAVFAVMHNFKSTVALYDTRNFDAPPFLSVQLNDPILPQRSAPMRTPYYTSCVFSRDGKWMLVGTSGATHYVLDAFECQIVARLEGHVGYDLPGPRSGPAQPYNSGCEVCWSPDSRFVLSGSTDGQVYVWDVHPPNLGEARGPDVTLQPAAVLSGGHGDQPVRTIAFNPALAMFVTGGSELVFWTPP